MGGASTPRASAAAARRKRPPDGAPGGLPGSTDPAALLLDGPDRGPDPGAWRGPARWGLRLPSHGDDEHAGAHAALDGGGHEVLRRVGHRGVSRRVRVPLRPGEGDETGLRSEVPHCQAHNQGCDHLEPGIFAVDEPEARRYHPEQHRPGESFGIDRAHRSKILRGILPRPAADHARPGISCEGGDHSMSEVKVREGETFESALRRFNKKIKQNGVLSEVRRREHYEKPSVRRKKKLMAARKRRSKAS